MLKNYIKIAFRNLWRYKAFSFLNIMGLSIGLASSILILLWVANERSYDSFHENVAKTYRITSGLADDFRAATVPPPLAPELLQKLPIVDNYLRLSHPVNFAFERDGNRFEEKRGFYADSTFWDFFSFALVDGEKKTAFHQPDAILITESMAKKYFGQTNVVGQSIILENRKPLTVTAVFADLPSNSHLQFDYLLPMEHIEKESWMNDAKQDWRNFVNYAYLKLDDSFVPTSTAIHQLEQQIQEVFSKHVDGSMLKTTFQLQAMPDIHLHSTNLQVDLAGRSNSLYVDTLFMVALFILVVACINFMNLSTARSARRAKEVGLRKVIGAERTQIIIQFMGESLLITFLSFVIAIALVWLALPGFQVLISKTLEIHLFDPNVLLTLLAIALITGLIAGSYPALYLSGFTPIKVLKGVLTSGKRGHVVFRNTLVVTQFIVSMFLLVGTIVIYQQLNFVKNRNLGFDKSNLVYVEMNGEVWGKQSAYKDALASNPLTADFTVSDVVPTNLKSGTVDFYYEGKDPNSELIAPTMDVSENFIEAFGMEMVSGRSFSKSYNDSSNYIINEKLASIIGYTPEEAIGKPFALWSNKGQIVGVVKDFSFKPASKAIEPLILSYNQWGGMFIIKAKPQQLEATINALEKIHADLNPHFPFTYGFVDQELDKLYESEHRLSNLFNLFAALGIFISCLGLYGLSAFMAEKRIKEIGIRKVLGSSVTGIVYLLTKSFIGLLALAIVISIPIAWYGASRWLDSFAFKIDINWMIFGLAAGLTFIVALLTIGYESIKAARANPVDSLRDE